LRIKLQNLKIGQKVTITEVSVEHERINKVKISSDCRVERRIFKESTENGYSYYGLNDGSKTLESQGNLTVA